MIDVHLLVDYPPSRFRKQSVDVKLTAKYHAMLADTTMYFYQWMPTDFRSTAPFFPFMRNVRLDELATSALLRLRALRLRAAIVSPNHHPIFKWQMPPPNNEPAVLVEPIFDIETCSGAVWRYMLKQKATKEPSGIPDRFPSSVD